MNSHPQTIQIFLPSGDPQGIRIASITTRIVQLIEVRRSLLADFLKMPEAAQDGLYFPVGESEGVEQRQFYIGQTGSFAYRLSQHNQRREFWNRALVAITLTNNLTGTHADFLGWLSISETTKAGHFRMDNCNASSRARTPAPLQAEGLELFDTVRTPLATLGQLIFEPLAHPSSRSDARRLFYCRASEAGAQGPYTEEGFVDLKGSTGRLETVPSFQKHGYQLVRDRLRDQDVLVEIESRIRFKREHPFSSPSAAAACVAGHTANGLVEWKYANGSTLGGGFNSESQHAS